METISYAVFTLGTSAIAALTYDPVQRNRHGDRREVRKLQASSALNEYSDWPHLTQVCRIEREVTRKGETKREVAYAVTSLWPHEAGPSRLLELNRGHWGIEKRLDYVRDVTSGEDTGQVRTGSPPQVMAVLRNATIGLLRVAGATNIAAALRRNSAHPEEALALLGISYTCHQKTLLFRSFVPDRALVPLAGVYATFGLARALLGFTPPIPATVASAASSAHVGWSERARGYSGCIC